ncbi:hypothetical protein C1H46_018183 [Malus baccata]|uniref:DNA-binding protein n=2 Tax=Malus TaxID=3749 RepID=A0A540MBT4_MALBA|nr:hypothetical protein C1H46_018183 [Malus baccata]
MRLCGSNGVSYASGTRHGPHLPVNVSQEGSLEAYINGFTRLSCRAQDLGVLRPKKALKLEHLDKKLGMFEQFSALPKRHTMPLPCTMICCTTKHLHPPAMMLSQIVSGEARERIARIALVKPEKARGVEDVILRAAQMGQIVEKVSEERLISLLEQINNQTNKQTKVTIPRRRSVLEDDD